MSERLPIILDVDTGTDDALAIAYAIASPRIELVAVTTVAGNVGVEKATTNSLAVLDWLGETSVPVHRGASRPLVQPHQDAVGYHHEDGLGGAQLPESSRGIGHDRGPAAMVRLAKERPGELTLVAVGPLTNVAIALNVEPLLTKLLKAVVVMGGAFRVPGNVTSAAEFNIFVDPEAAEQVFSAPFASISVVGLDVTNQVALDREDWRTVACRQDLPRSAQLLREVGKHAFTTLGNSRFSLHDPLAVAVSLDSGLADWEGSAVTIDLDGENKGQTRMAGPGNVQVATSVDAKSALQDFRRTVGLPLASS